jgi:hypothetical protein
MLRLNKKEANVLDNLFQAVLSEAHDMLKDASTREKIQIKKDIAVISRLSNRLSKSQSSAKNILNKLKSLLCLD